MVKPDDTVFQEAAEFYKIPVNWIRAIASTESDFRLDPPPRWEPHLAEHSYGLGQFLKSTAISMIWRLPYDLANKGLRIIYEERQGSESGINRFLQDKEVSVYLIGAYLSYLRERFGSNILDLAAAYNAGSVKKTSTGEYTNAGYVERFQDRLGKMVALFPGDA